jgi:hypothetical protein
MVPGQVPDDPCCAKLCTCPQLHAEACHTRRLQQPLVAHAARIAYLTPLSNHAARRSPHTPLAAHAARSASSGRTSRTSRTSRTVTAIMPVRALPAPCRRHRSHGLAAQAALYARRSPPTACSSPHTSTCRTLSVLQRGNSPQASAFRL